MYITESKYFSDDRYLFCLIMRAGNLIRQYSFTAQNKQYQKIIKRSKYDDCEFELYYYVRNLKEK